MPSVSHAFHKRADSPDVETLRPWWTGLPMTIVDYAFGSGNRGVSLVGHDQAGGYIEYRLSLYPDQVGWEVTPGQTLNPNQYSALYQGKPIQTSMIAKCCCLECHHTSSHAVLTGHRPRLRRTRRLAASGATGRAVTHESGQLRVFVRAKTPTSPSGVLPWHPARPSSSSARSLYFGEDGSQAHAGRAMLSGFPGHHAGLEPL